MTVAEKANVNLSDQDSVIAKKIKVWVVRDAPNLVPSEVKTQGGIAWNAIKTSQGRSTSGFEGAWRGAHSQ